MNERRLKLKAAVIEKYGNEDELKIIDVKKPKAAADEVVVKIVATAVNPVDWKVREGYLQELVTYDFPIILGWDVAGIIEEVGENVKSFKVGDEVYSKPDLARDGSYAEYIAIKASDVAFKPKSISFQEAASLPLVSITAWESVIDKGNIKKGDKILIHAGSGGVGTIAIQLAKWKGAYVITTCSEKNFDLVKSLGADEVIDYTKVNFEDVVSDIDVVFDTIGGDVQDRSWNVLKKGGVLVAITQTPSEETAKKFNVSSHLVFIDPNGPILKELAELVDQGIVKPVVGALYNLEDIKKAHILSQSGRAKGKIVINI